MLSTLKLKPTKCWEIFPLWNGRFQEGVRVKKETTIGCFYDKGGKGSFP